MSTDTPTPVPPARLAPDRILIPARAEGPGGVVGDGARIIGPEDPAWAVWDQWLTPTG